MNRPKYSLVLTGRLIPGARLDAVAEKVARVFQVPPEQAATLLSEAPVVIKRGDDRAALVALASKLMSAGVIVHVRTDGALSADGQAATDPKSSTPAGGEEVATLTGRLWAAMRQPRARYGAVIAGIMVSTLTLILLSTAHHYRPDEIFDKYGGTVAQVRGLHSSGTGFVAADRFFTNHHVIDSELLKDVTLLFPAATVPSNGLVLTFVDKDRDIAVFKMRDGKGFRQATIGDGGAAMRPGDVITIIGNPGLGGGVVRNSVTVGALGGMHSIDNKTYYQLSASVNSGNSGGPAFDSLGRVIAMVTLKAGGKEGLAFGIPGAVLLDSLQREVSDDRLADLASRHDGVALAKRIVTVCAAYSSVYSKIFESLSSADGRLAQRLLFKFAGTALGSMDLEAIDRIVSEDDIAAVYANDAAPRELRDAIYATWQLHMKIRRQVIAGDLDGVENLGEDMGRLARHLTYLSGYVARAD